MIERLAEFKRTMLGVASAGALTGALLLSACADGTKEVNPDVTIEGIGGAATEDTTSVESTSTTTTVAADTGELIDNIFNPTAEELKAFSCMAEENKLYGVEYAKTAKGVKLVIPVMPVQMGVDRAKRDFLHRDESNSLNNPYTVTDLNNGELVLAETAANWCNKPALLAATIHKMTNTMFRDQLVGANSPMLQQFVGKTPDEVVAMLVNPYPQEDVTKEQEAANIAATLERQKYAEYVVAVFKSLQYEGKVDNVQLSSHYALSENYIFNPDGPVLFDDAEYIGSEVNFSYYDKGTGCRLASFALNAGTTNPEDEGGDMRPVTVIDEEVCSTPPISTPDTTNPHETYPPVTYNPKLDNGTVPHQGTGGGEPVKGDPTPDNGEPNPVGGTLPPVSTEAPVVPQTTAQPVTPNTKPVDTIPPAPLG